METTVSIEVPSKKPAKRRAAFFSVCIEKSPRRRAHFKRKSTAERSAVSIFIKSEDMRLGFYTNRLQVCLKGARRSRQNLDCKRRLQSNREVFYAAYPKRTGA
ncbi:MAG: hypothetical protein Q4C72_06795 [Eubacteriales bacterium]|nr:hypothetical protein [Eubacteriales bacterium]